MKYKGKVAIWFWVVFFAGNAVCLYGMCSPGGGLTAAGIGLVIYDLVFLPIFLRNYVILEEDTLTVYFGIGKDSIKIREIVEVQETHDPIASSAASLDRIMIKTRRQKLMCSVVEKEAFLRELRKRNPKIQFR